VSDGDVLKLSGNMLSIPISEADRQAYRDILAARDAAEVRISCHAVTVTFVVSVSDPLAAKTVVQNMTEDLHDADDVMSIYYGDTAKACECDEWGDVYEDSFDGFPKV
jgi:transcriptional/translational regulatory protein YebC/TACO1